MTVDEYTNDFTDEMEFTLHVVPDELSKIDRYSKGLPQEYYVPVKQAHTFETGISATSLVEDMINRTSATRQKLAK